MQPCSNVLLLRQLSKTGENINHWSYFKLFLLNESDIEGNYSQERKALEKAI